MALAIPVKIFKEGLSWMAYRKIPYPKKSRMVNFEKS